MSIKLLLVEDYKEDLNRLHEFSQKQTQNIHHQAFYVAQYEQELSRFPINVLRKVENKFYREKDKVSKRLKRTAKIRTHKNLKRIVIDLTPVLPGGENGGAKLLATALTWQFSRNVDPQCEYFLLTSNDSHDELSWLDAKNVQRICVNRRHQAVEPMIEKDIGEGEERLKADILVQNQVENAIPGIPKAENISRSTIEQSYRNSIHSFGVFLEKVLPRSLYRKVYKLYKTDTKSSLAGNFVSELGADLLFCPFTGPHYYSPEVPMVIVVHDLQY